MGATAPIFVSDSDSEPSVPNHPAGVSLSLVIFSSGVSLSCPIMFRQASSLLRVHLCDLSLLHLLPCRYTYYEMELIFASSAVVCSREMKVLPAVPASSGGSRQVVVVVIDVFH